MNEAESFLAALPDEERSWRRFVPHAVIAVAVAFMGVLLYRLLSDDSTPRSTVSQVVTVKLVKPPPPPPPPKEVEPTKDETEIKPEPLERPVPMERPPPLAAPAAPGMPGPPGPGIAGLPGGGAPGGIAGGGGGGGGGGDPFGSYAALLQSRVQGAVQRQPVLRRSRYQVQVQIWLTEDGKPRRVELLNSLGDKDLDKRFRDTLMAMGRLPYAPPPEMPQPIVLRVNSL